MTLCRKLAIWSATLSLATFAAGSTQAFMGECSVAFNSKTFEEQADKPEITVQDTVEHQPLTINFQGKTLRTVKPGDTVEAHGEQHVLLEVHQRANWSQYTFASQSDVDRYHTALTGGQGDGVEHVGVENTGVEHGGDGSHK